MLRVEILKKSLVLVEDAKSMEVGQVGHLGQIVEIIVRCPDLETVQILLLKMVVLTV